MSLDAVMTILGKYDEGPLPAALAVVGGVVVLKFGLGVSVFILFHARIYLGNAPHSA
jgi:hypothetical protein